LQLAAKPRSIDVSILLYSRRGLQRELICKAILYDAEFQSSCIRGVVCNQLFADYFALVVFVSILLYSRRGLQLAQHTLKLKSAIRFNPLVVEAWFATSTVEY
jgi:hypothetical protein